MTLLTFYISYRMFGNKQKKKIASREEGKCPPEDGVKDKQ